MSDLEQNNQHDRNRTSGAVWNVAAVSAFAFLLSVLGAKLLSNMVEGDAATRLAYDRAMREVAANAAQREQQPATQTYSIVRSLGVDGVTTATIPIRKAAPVSPCGDNTAPGAGTK